MGTKQSKRSVDISGKEAESAGEVAAAIAGGEGRVEQLADADALKPQLNGDAHIHETDEKQKDVDSGTPENEKDATTEKEAKQQEEEKEAAPLTNGESEPKVENGESTPTPEDGKKPKKEKVKKKWSLRSISFSRKDKPKQEKKQKDEEPKTNGEPEKVPEETAEAAPEVPAVTETVEDVKTPSEVKEDKTPETPVTEPITNGSSTPESPKVETPVVEDPAVPSPESEKVEPKAEVEPEQLPVNGLSLEEPAKETTENEKNEDSKEETITETTEIVPEISVKKEVCVEQMPLIDSTPPPLPANPPPSSVASFAATTMAPELTDASLANTADNAIPPTPPSSDTITKEKLDIISPESETDLTVTRTVSNELSSPVKDVSETMVLIAVNGVESGNKETAENDDATGIIVPVLVENVREVVRDTIENFVIDKEQALHNTEPVSSSDLIEKTDIESEPLMPSPPPEVDEITENKETINSESADPEMPSPPSELVEEPAMEQDKPLSESDQTMPTPPSELIEDPIIENETKKEELSEVSVLSPKVVAEPITEDSVVKEELSASPEPDMPAPPADDNIVTEVNTDILNNVENLPPPPPPICDDAAAEGKVNISEAISDTNNISVTNHISDVEIESTDEVELNDDNQDLEQNLKNKSMDSLGNLIKTIECNGNMEGEKAISEKESAQIIPPTHVEEIVNVSGRTAPSSKASLTSEKEDNVVAESFPAPPSDCLPATPDPATLQEPLPVSDKLADLIPEVPELKTETLQETTSDVAVAN